MAQKEVMDTRKWMYIDTNTGQQKGPFTQELIKRLLRRGFLTSKQFIWAPEMINWQQIFVTSPFDTFCKVWNASWYYYNDEKIQIGPITLKELMNAFIDGTIDGLTFVWSDIMSNWEELGKVEILKEFLQAANEDLDRESMAIDQMNPIDQIYTEPSIDAYVAEDGKSYRFDTETNSFITPERKIEEDLQALKDLESTEDHDSMENIMNHSNTIEHGDKIDKQDRKHKKKTKKKKWKAAKSNTWVYVTKLPLDITMNEMQTHFSKCGLIQTDLVTGGPRIKLYMNKETGELNGDASVCYMKEESVQLAVEILDQVDIRPNCTIDVKPAEFTQKGEEFIAKKRIKLDTKAKIKQLEQEKSLAWNEGEDGNRGGLRIVVLSNVFTPDDVATDALEAELAEDMTEECAKIGEISKLTIFPKHEEGVVIVKYASSGSAAKCIEVMNGRYFAGRQIKCSYWDGTDYTVKESHEEQEKRSENFKEWLEGGDSSDSSDSDVEVKIADVHSGRQLPSLDKDSSDDDNSEAEDNGN